MALNLANVISTDTFQTWLTRTNQIIERASNTTPDALTFIGNTAVVPHSEGKLFYDNSVDTLRYFASANTSIAVGHEVNIYVKNNTGSVIPKGSAVYSDGEDNAIPTIQLSKADAESTHDVLGLTKEEINVGDTGHVTVTGIVFTDTSSFSVGNQLYVSPTTAGALTATEPTFPNFPVRIGKVLLSSATQGCILVSIVDETFGEIRSTENARVDGNLTVAGNFSVLGSETITSVTNLQVDDSFVYLNGGDTLVANTTLVTGLSDLTFKGHYNGGNTVTYYIKIDNTNPGNPDTFSWSLDNFSSTEAANVAITGAQQLLRWGISAQFVANTGHTAGDIWTSPAAPINIDTGWASNRNVGQAAGGYTHLGMFLDASDTRFKVFQSYRPSVGGTINVSDPSFEYGLVQANTFYSTGSGQIIIPTGNTNQRVSDTLGSLRYNTEAGQFEGYGAEGWGQIGGGGLGKFLFKNSNYVASTGDRIAANTAGGGFTITLPASPAQDDIVEIIDEDNTFNSGNLTVARNGSTIENVAQDLVADISGTNFYCQYDGTTWRVFGLATGTQYFAGTLSVNALDVTESVTANTGSFTGTVSAQTGSFTGTVSAQDFNSTSDIAFKQDISTITDASSVINKLRGVSFKWKNSEQSSYGLVAQELENVVPNLVTKNVDGTKSVKYNGLIGFLIESNKQLQQRIEALEQKLQDN